MDLQTKVSLILAVTFTLTLILTSIGARMYGQDK